MKKRNLLLSTLAAASVIASATALAACGKNNGDEHNHAFTQELVGTDYLKTEATCTEKAVYYKSCVCGEKGSETFEYGETGEHSFTCELVGTDYLKTARTCTQAAVYYKSCACGEKGDETFRYGLPEGHWFNKEVADAKCLKYEATCTLKAEYYKTCSVCGEAGTGAFADTFTAGEEPNGHNFTGGVCSVCGEKSASEGLEFTLSDDGKSYGVSIGSCESSDVTIPSSYEGKPVTAVISFRRTHAVRNETLTSVTIGNRVTEIGGYAFSDCVALTSVTIPKSVTNIGDGAFNNCMSLTSVTIGNGVTEIGGYAFSDCVALTSVTIPNSVTNIGVRSFWGCKALTIYCEASQKPDGWLKDGVLYEWNYFGTGSVGEQRHCPVVWNCKTNDKDEYGYAYTVVNGVRYSLKNGLAAVASQPSNLIGEIVILEKITYKNTECAVTEVSMYAFTECEGITGVVIPNGIRLIDMYAFRNCINATVFRFLGTKEQWDSVQKYDNWWYNYANDYTLVCDDGKWDKDGNTVA